MKGSDGAGGKRQEKGIVKGRRDDERTCNAGRMVLAVVVVDPDTMPSASPLAAMRVP